MSGYISPLAVDVGQHPDWGGARDAEVAAAIEPSMTSGITHTSKWKRCRGCLLPDRWDNMFGRRSSRFGFVPAI
jgi:hypothetical protein